MIRCGKKMANIATVIIDEVQMLEDPDRGHRLDGMIARLKYLAPQAQFLYLSATIGFPKLLAKKLDCQLVRYDDRPVALERYLLFLERKQKIPTIKKLTTEEYKNTLDKGFRGQTIIFTNSRARLPHNSRSPRDAGGRLSRGAFEPGAPRGRDKIPGR